MNRAISKKVDVCFNIGLNFWQLENCLEWCENFCPTEVCLEGANLLKCCAEVCFVVFNRTIIWEHELIVWAVTTDVESASIGKWLEEQQEGLTTHRYSVTLHRATAVNQENVLFNVFASNYFFLPRTFFIFVNYWLVHDIRISVYFWGITALLVFYF
jgi:hypothetical protein